VSPREATRFVLVSLLQGVGAVLVLAVLGPVTLALVTRVTGH